jgi:titin
MMTRTCLPRLLFLIFLMTLSFSMHAANYVVTTTADAGAGSLRQAITDANSSPGGDNISFNIPVTDGGYNPSRHVWVLTPATAYPYLIGAYITIDAGTQTLNAGDSNVYGPEIMIDGNGTLANAFILASPACVIKGMIISRCVYGVIFYNSTCTSGTLSNCYIGTNETGSSAMGNQYGVGISGSATGVVIRDNLISGNTTAGIAVQAASNCTIAGNYIGTDRTGTVALPNDFGVAVDNGNGILIGGSVVADRNIIGGNNQSGVILNGSGAYNNTVKGNYIGLGPDGLNRVPNHVGLMLKTGADHNVIGGSTNADRNVISGNDEIGVYIEASDSNRVARNYIGPAADGTTPVMIADSMFQGNGIELNTVSKYNIIEDNVISGNRVYGFIFYGQVSENTLSFNLIGTDATGLTSMQNATGICVDGASNHNYIYNNLLSGNMSYGIFIVTTGTYYNRVMGNRIGVNIMGTDSLPNDIGLTLGGGARYNIIGGPGTDEANVISGNRYDGIEIADNMTDYNIIRNNLIGTDLSGTYAIPNVNGVALATYPAHNTIKENIISGNSEMGIILYEHADDNNIFGNYIGTNPGFDSIPNGLSGILIREGACRNHIGCDTNTNFIHYNGNGGIVISDSNCLQNSMIHNSLYHNAVLPGIDLYPYGCTANDAGDADSGPNGLLNYPIIETAEADSTPANWLVWGSVDIPDADSARIDVYAAAPNAWSCGEGSVFLGSTLTFGGNHWSLSGNGIVQSGSIITATCTDRFGNTSEFCPDVVMQDLSGIEENDAEVSVTIFPNPFAEQIHISAGGGLIQHIEIHTLTGQEIYSEERINRSTFTWNAEPSMAPGVYIISIDTGNQISRIAGFKR